MTAAPGHAGGPITVINVFEVPAERVGEFIAQWRARAEIMAAAAGFRDAMLHQAVSPQARFQLVNVAHWDSQADLEAAQGSGAFQDRIRALREDPQLRFSAYPAVYEIAAILTACPGPVPVRKSRQPGSAWSRSP